MSRLEQLVGFARDIERARRFSGNYQGHVYRGLYSSYAEAERAIPAGALKGFSHDSVVEVFQGGESHWKFHDYPVAFWLREVFNSEHVIFDLGGGWGQTYYAYAGHLEYPENLHWTVCDVEAFALRGAKIAFERSAKHLHFTTSRNDADGCGAFVTGGTLHYLEEGLPEILGRLNTKPRHVIVNRVPFYDGPSYYTVQRMHCSYAVNKVMNRKQFLDGMEALGYRLGDAWDQPRSLNVIFHPERSVTSYSGFYFCLEK